MWVKIKCFLGFHNWQPTGKSLLAYHSKRDTYTATPLVCEDCGKPSELREDYNW